MKPKRNWMKEGAQLTCAVLFLFIFVASVSSQLSSSSTGANDAAQTDVESKKGSLDAISSQEDFDQIARVYHQGTPYALPHVMFVIDRREKNRIYYVNTQRYRFHKDFLLANYLVPRGADVFKPIYIDEDRRFIVGTIAWQKPVERFTWELWEGDMATTELIKLTNEVINKSFFKPVAFKPNSLRQEDVSAKLGIERILQSDLSKNQAYLALNPGSAVGRIHIIEKLDDTVEIGDNEILVLKELPQSLPPVRGIIVAKPSTPLSHINILAKGWNIPNVYIKDADKLLKEFDTFVYKLDATLTDYKLTRASLDDIKTGFASPDQQIPPANLMVTKLAGLREMRRQDSVVYGSKSANLGEMLNAKLPAAIVPDGFTIPFYWYKKFMRENGLERRIQEMMEENEFVHNPRVRREKLEQFRTAVQAGKFDPQLRAMVLRKWRAQLGGRPVFVRSSSNSEDLPKFSGAGLYSSVANVRTANNLIEAIKKVWASLWKFEAYEARMRNYVSQSDVYMSALIQLGINMNKGGVMITKDPFNRDSRDEVYISAVCGHNSRVVDNTGIPEQILFNPRSNSISVMTLSQQENALTFDLRGDLRETADRCADTQKRVLSDAEARNLAKTALEIRNTFGGQKPQDIEWGIMNGRIYIVQARPYIEK
jgi:rifampicin phosphotransferase